MSFRKMMMGVLAAGVAVGGLSAIAFAGEIEFSNLIVSVVIA